MLPAGKIGRTTMKRNFKIISPVTLAGVLALAGMALAHKASATDAVPAVYTDAQAQAGAAVYGQNCGSCHGAALDGVAAPALKGPAFHDMAAAQSLTADALLTVVSV